METNSIPKMSIGITPSDTTQQQATIDRSATAIDSNPPTQTCTGITLDSDSDPSHIAVSSTTSQMESNIIPTINKNAQTVTSLINNIVGPLIQEMRVLEESVHSDYAKLHGDYSRLDGIITTQQTIIAKLETSITSQQKDISNALMDRIEKNTAQISMCIKENCEL